MTFNTQVVRVAIVAFYFHFNANKINGFPRVYFQKYLMLWPEFCFYKT